MRPIARGANDKAPEPPRSRREAYRRIRMKIWITYQNISAIDENSASAAATCWRGS
jgi:hypothetical protein